MIMPCSLKKITLQIAHYEISDKAFGIMDWKVLYRSNGIKGLEDLREELYPMIPSVYMGGVIGHYCCFFILQYLLT